MKNKVNIERFLEKYYGDSDSIILACSGGPDSMFLLYEILKTKYAQNLIVCYFNHKTREQTDIEEAYLEKLGEEKGFRVEVGECDFEQIKKLYPSKSFEELAREKRYQFFDAIMNIHNSKYVITGHHLDDRIETFFFNMLRGTKLTGLINMTESSGGVLRPLLEIEKSEIQEYLDANAFKYFIDETNSNTNITRNKMRLEILPLMGEIHPNHKQNIANLLKYFEEMKNNIDSQIDDFLGDSEYFDIVLFQSRSGVIQTEIIRTIYYKSNDKSTIGLSEANITEVIRFINGPNGNTKKDIKNMKLYKKSGKIYF